MTYLCPRNRRARFRGEHCRRGFTLIELMLVVTVCVVLAGIAIPRLLSAMHASRLRGAMADFSSLVETSRIYAIRDNRFYSIYVLASSGTNPQEAYVDMLPRSLTGASGNGGTSVTSGDPVIALPSEVTPRSAASAPGTSALSSQLLPSVTTVTPTDASLTSTPATFGPRGLPCLTLTVTNGTVSGTVCDSSAGPVAYWIFFQDSASGNWGAVTVTPAGRIQKWYYDYGASAWAKA
jgi:prepilin-type N-terminal cleavage/methylation domain-containing protein